jgi:hypothetical protein
MGVQIVQIFPNGKESFHLQWEVDESTINAAPFNWTLLRAGSPQGPWTTAQADLGNVFTADDTFSLAQGMNKDVFYKIVDPVKGIESGPRSLMPGLPIKKYLIWRKMVNDQRVLLKKGMGIRMYVLKRKHFGPRCTVCWDKKTGRILVKDCEACFGTSFTGGYYSPIEIYGHLKPAPVGTDHLADTNIPEVQNTNGYFLAYPLIKKGDIVVEQEVNLRWEVVSAVDTQLLRNPVHQDVTLSRLGTANVVYKVPVG